MTFKTETDLEWYLCILSLLIQWIDHILGFSAIKWGNVDFLIVTNSFCDFPGETLRPGLSQLCKNAMGHLTTSGIYPALQVQQLLMILLAHLPSITGTATIDDLTSPSTRHYRYSNYWWSYWPIYPALQVQQLLMISLVHLPSITGTATIDGLTVPSTQHYRYSNYWWSH